MNISYGTILSETAFIEELGSFQWKLFFWSLCPVFFTSYSLGIMSLVFCNIKFLNSGFLVLLMQSVVGLRKYNALPTVWCFNYGIMRQ